MKCKICHNQSDVIFDAVVLYKYNVKYYQCKNCGFGQTEEPYWLQESYISPMNLSDTGVMFRSERMSKITTTLLYLFFNKNGTFLDYAGLPPDSTLPGLSLRPVVENPGAPCPREVLCAEMAVNKHEPSWQARCAADARFKYCAWSAGQQPERP